VKTCIISDKSSDIVSKKFFHNIDYGFMKLLKNLMNLTLEADMIKDIKCFLREE
jgi:hypothetical protein